MDGENSGQMNNENWVKKGCMVVLLAMAGWMVVPAQDSVQVEYWEIDNLESIGGHAVSYQGDPQVVNVEGGKAIAFDGDGELPLDTP